MLNKRYVKRASRIAAFGLGAGLVSPAAGSWLGIDSITSALFGAAVVLIALISALLLTYAGKGELTDKDFDAHINESIEAVKSNAKKSK